MLVKDLVAWLLTQDQDMPVAIKMYSDFLELDVDEIEIRKLCFPRSDGWVQNYRPDKTSINYLVFPGN